jgi:hypothetical protein
VRTIPLLLTIAVLELGARAAVAQRVTAWEVGMASLDEDVRLLQVGYRASWVNPGHVGVDFSVAASPVGLLSLFIHGALDLDAAYAVVLDSATSLHLRAGGTAFVAASQYGAGLTGGFNVGFGIVGRTSATSGIRLDVVQRWFPTEYETYSATSVTVGIAVFR